MRSKKFRGSLCLFHVVLCAMVFNQQSFAGTWTDAFEDNNTHGWKIVNNINNSKWWIDAGEIVCETFAPNVPSILATGEVDWRNYSFSCKAKLDKAKDEPATFGIILHHRWEEFSFYAFRIFYPWEIVHITKYNPAGASTVGEFDFPAKLDTWYTLTASIDSRGKLKFQIDDVVFTAVDAAPIKNGKAGLIVSNAQARFDNVEITGDNVPNGGPGTLPVEPSGNKLAITWGELKLQ
ncbi:hypothetical protein C6500_18790 [Candidatus Poribacteria bacterium]|nr:MAG: hypothetical protein C6500_18790 [Candidatus Poribacteria bacterium]